MDRCRDQGYNEAASTQALPKGGLVLLTKKYKVKKGWMRKR